MLQSLILKYQKYWKVESNSAETLLSVTVKKLRVTRKNEKVSGSFRLIFAVCFLFSILILCLCFNLPYLLISNWFCICILLNSNINIKLNSIG